MSVKYFFASSIALLVICALASEEQRKCDTQSPSNTVKISVRSRRNELGKWVTEFATGGAAGEIADGLSLNISTDLTTCDDVELVNIQGSLEVEVRREATRPSQISTKKNTKKTQNILQFSEKTGRNVELSNNLRTAKRLNIKKDFRGGTVVTGRPLDNDEIFDVLLEKLSGSWSGSIMVGVTNIPPASMDFSKDCPTKSCGVWQYSDDDNNLQVGARIRVIRNAEGKLSIFVNGKLELYEDVPETVYGYVNLYGIAEQATILSVFE